MVPSVAVTSLRHVQGPLPVTAVSILQLHFMAGLPAGYGSLLSSHLFLASTLFFSLPYLSFCFSPFLLFSIYQLLLLLFPFSFFPAISYQFLFCPICTTQTLLPCPSLPQFNTQRLHLPSQYQCYQIVSCSQLLPLLVFLLSFSPHYYVSFCLPALHSVILSWSSAGLQLLPPPLVYVKISYHLLYLFLHLCPLF
jgi:hypothetical protein